MKWTKKFPKRDEDRIVKRFLFFPLGLSSSDTSCTIEYKWLRIAKIKQRYTRYPNSGYWDNKRWAD